MKFVRLVLQTAQHAITAMIFSTQKELYARHAGQVLSLIEINKFADQTAPTLLCTLTSRDINAQFALMELLSMKTLDIAKHVPLAVVLVSEIELHVTLSALNVHQEEFSIEKGDYAAETALQMKNSIGKLSRAEFARHIKLIHFIAKNVNLVGLDVLIVSLSHQIQISHLPAWNVTTVLCSIFSHSNANLTVTLQIGGTMILIHAKTVPKVNFWTQFSTNAETVPIGIALSVLKEVILLHSQIVKNAEMGSSLTNMETAKNVPPILSSNSIDLSV